MKNLVKTAAIALTAAAGISSAAAGISNTVSISSLYPDHTTEDAAKALQTAGGTGLSFEDLRVGPMGKVAVDLGSIEVPVRVAGTTDNCSG
jgi:hypothetical protein